MATKPYREGEAQNPEDLDNNDLERFAGEIFDEPPGEKAPRKAFEEAEIFLGDEVEVTFNDEPPFTGVITKFYTLQDGSLMAKVEMKNGHFRGVLHEMFMQGSVNIKVVRQGNIGTVYKP